MTQKEVFICRIKGKNAKKIAEALDGSGIIIYRQEDETRDILDLYTEKQHGKHTLQ